MLNYFPFFTISFEQLHIITLSVRLDCDFYIKKNISFIHLSIILMVILHTNIISENLNVVVI